VTGIVQLITHFGQRIGRLFLAKTKRKTPSESEIAKHTLLRVMRDWSEDAYQAGWHDGLEITIWRMIQMWKAGDPNVRELDAAMFHYLSEKAKGWWMWDEDAQHGCGCPVFVPMKTWKGVYAKLMDYAEQAKKEGSNNDTTA
jgi:hypothetical protein